MEKHNKKRINSEFANFKLRIVNIVRYGDIHSDDNGKMSLFSQFSHSVQ